MILDLRPSFKIKQKHPYFLEFEKSLSITKRKPSNQLISVMFLGMQILNGIM